MRAGFTALVFTNMISRKYTTMKYGENPLEVTREMCEKWANRLYEKVINRENVQHDVWIVPALFQATHYINAGFHLPADGTSEVERILRVWNNYAEYYQRLSPDNASDLLGYHVLGIRAERNINFGEELYGDYGISYIFNRLGKLEKCI